MVLQDLIVDPWLGSLLIALERIWHNQRTTILLATFVVLVTLRFYLHLKGDKPEPLKVWPGVYNGVTDAKSGLTSAAVEKSVEPRPNSTSVETIAKTDAGPRRIQGALRRSRTSPASPESTVEKQVKVLVFFSSLTTNTARAATSYAESLAATFVDDNRFAKPEILDLAEVDFDDYFITPPKSQTDVFDLFYAFLVPSYDTDTINDTFLEHLKETHNDFRIDKGSLSTLLGYSVFGYGDREGWPTEEEGFCHQAKELDKWMAKLTARKRAYPLGMGDIKSDAVGRLAEWSEGLNEVLRSVAATGSLGEGVPGSGDAVESDDEAPADEDDEVVIEGKSAATRKLTTSLDDVEDIGRILGSAEKGESRSSAAPLPVDFTGNGQSTKKSMPALKKEMVPKDSPTYKSLTKQGYAIVGSHSGVKICRWTKSALRSRGSCYKFSFYGINSHQCMETTPSLSCSNKCVFCWRHGTNPVGTNWRWVVDPPQLIFDGVKENHYKKIKSLRGVPGVRAERFAEAMKIRHCALSLVGEPIFYPHINEFVGMLHKERISSFLVCNAQHPDQLAALNHVTQLYVSIDASNKESLRKIDRPLHRDFWERFQKCIEILREKRQKQRTVFRLTLVKGFNIEDEVNGYADLVEKGLPCFVEVKGVTFCGTSTAPGGGLRMTNVPFYNEVCEFVTALEAELQRRGLGYGIAAEHSHSCCVLIGNDRFKIDGRWHTTIDYDRFFQLLEDHGPDGDFGPEDYIGPETPEWATWGNGGFDPRDTRVDRHGNPIQR